MITTFSYPLPDELYVEGVSGKITGTFTYDGPETFDVQIDQSGNIIDIDIQNDPELGPDYRKTINATKNPEVAYMFAHYFIEDYHPPVSDTVDEVMENGDVYKKPLNPDLTTAYQVNYNTQDNDWELVQIVKQQDNPSTLEAKKRKEYIQKYADKYSFGVEVDDAIETYITLLDTFIENNPLLKTWKYINFNSNPVPKIPVSIAVELSKIPNEEV
jgi:hypothetical protein